MADFIHLHVHTEYSLLDGLVKIPELIDKAKSYNMGSLALTDHGAMYGAFHFYKKTIAAGIKPIIGFEAYQAKRSRHDKESGIDNDRFHLTLLAKNTEGYRNLMRLTTESHLDGFYYKPRIDFELLEKYKEGIICLSGCLNGLVPSLIKEHKMADAELMIRKYASIFKDDYYLELQKHPGIAVCDDVNTELIKYSRKFGIPVVATNDVHYLEKEDAYAQEILLCIQTQRTIIEKNRPMSMIDCPDFYFKSGDEMMSQFSEYPEAVSNSLLIADKCNLDIETRKWILPSFKTPDDMKPEEYLRQMTYERVPTRFSAVTDEMKKRIEYELDVICTKGYATYFLIVQDFVNWAKNQGIGVGPGRGSAAGSLVAFILHITEIDPLHHVIPFERFLNPHRPSPPDIDMDFADDRRDEVIQYVTKKYGEDKVAQIITFGTMEARAAIRDAGRALGMPYSQPDRVAKLIPVGAQGFSMNLKKALELSPELKTAYDSEPDTQNLIKLAMKLEGLSRHASVHAAGVVIADAPLTNYVPLQKETRFGKIITQYDMYALDLNAAPDGQAVGLLKMDFLGLRNLSILEKAMKSIKANRNETILLSTISLEDTMTYDLIGNGETVGVFQLESAGMRRLGKNLKPNKFSDISAMVALYRPGPMAWIDEFINSKKYPEKIHYPHPDLKPILSESYGIAVYQEQCMQIANVMAGYTMAEADRLRMAIGKKKKELMKKEHDAFIAGCLKKGYKKTVAENVFALIEKFVGYGFNKAHSACYGMIAYWTAYLKAHYPVEFMTALLTAENDGTSGPVREEKLRKAIDECRRMNLPILPPDINTSQIEFTVENGNSIRFGLSAIKNVGSAAIAVILEARQDKPFVSFADFVTRVDLGKVNKKTLECLIKVGAFDRFGKRASLLVGYADFVSWAQQNKKDGQEKDQQSLFSVSFKQKEPSVPEVDEFSKRELLGYEHELLGFYLSEHPLTDKLAKMDKSKYVRITDCTTIPTGGKVNIAVLVTRIKTVMTKKKNQEMAFATLEDESGSIDAVVFPTIYSSTKSFWRPDRLLTVSGSIDRREDKLNVLVDSIFPLDL